MAVEHSDCEWHVSEEAHAVLKDDRSVWGETKYSDGKQAFKDYLCEFFTAEGGCTTKFGTISPMGANADGGKIFKMRWMRPGEGKSGGYRFTVVVYCDIPKVVLCGAALRKDEPDAAAVAAAGELASRTYPGRRQT